MKIGDGPAAVTGIVLCIRPLTFHTDVGKAQGGKTLRESEDLPEQNMESAVVDISIQTDLADTKGHPRV